MATCELCGKTVPFTTKIKVAGTNMQACNSCKSLGKVVDSDKDLSKSHTFRQNKKLNSSEEIISNYISVLKSALSQNEMTIHHLAKLTNIKESSLNQYFSGKIKPDLQIAKKLEKYLNVKLTEGINTINHQDYIVSEESDEVEKENLSLGDLLLKKIKDKK